jgi:5-methylcytosine-specific restriction endonuclease McrA
MWQEGKKKFAEKYGISELAATRFQCTAEHLKARSDGGSNDTNNIVAACYFCNHTRHTRKNPMEL